jgi:hypothetical protein
MFSVPGNRDLECPREGQSLRPWIAEITRRANRRIHGPNVEESLNDILIRQPEIPDASPPMLFQLTGPFANSPAPWDKCPSDTWWFAPATRVMYYPSSAAPPSTWQTPADEGDTNTTPETVRVWMPASCVQTEIAIEESERVWCLRDDATGAWVVVARAQTVSYGYATAYDQYLSGGSGYQLPSFGSLPLTAMQAGDGTSGILETTIPGTYLILGGLSVAPGPTTYSGSTGTIATPPDAPFAAGIGINGAPLTPDAQAHFHCRTDPNNTAVPWKISTGAIALPPITAGSLAFSIPANAFGAGIPSGPTGINGPSVNEAQPDIASFDINLPALPSATGSVSMAKLAHLNIHDQIGLFVQCAYGFEVTTAYLIVQRIGPYGSQFRAAAKWPTD